MRLINTQTLLLEEFVDDNVPAYAILSHTWGRGEINFQDMQRPEIAREKNGWLKAKSACRLAAHNGFSYLWMDTACINRTGSTELTETINSISEWFKRAGQCLVYLADVVAEDLSSFARCRWFTRGWTLIELIAPAKVDFYSRDWELIGSRLDLVDRISDITGIDPFVLAGGDVNQVKVARRMYWASGRHTTRVEDQAYCLMGLFNVQMPLRYGEGEASFMRLQKEIYKHTNDPSIFAWKKDFDWQEFARDQEEGLNSQTGSRILNAFFAKSPADFAHCGAIFPPLGVELAEENDDDALEDESLWDSMSTTSTLVQSSVDEPANPALNHAIAFLNDDPELFPLFQAAMERPGVGVDRFRRILVGILRHLTVELAQEATDKDQQSSASLVRRYRLVIGSAITANVAERTLKPTELEHDSLKHQPRGVDANEGETLDQDREDSEDGEVDNKAEDPFEVDVQFHSIATFIRSSKAFEQMVKRLTDIAYPSFRSRAAEFVEKLLRIKHRESENLEHWGAMRSRMGLIISELHYSKPESFFIDGEDKLSRFERFQLGWESLTGGEWNWWPLKRPRPELGPGESRLGWICSCGDPRWEAVPEEFAQHLALLARKFPLANSSPLPVAPPPAWNPAQATASTGKGSAPKGPPNLPAHGPTGGTGSTSASLPSSAYQTAIQGPVVARYIFLVTQLGRYTLDELPSLHLDTANFGSELRSAYLRRKGFWRSWLSPYGFSHCDFAKFEKYRRNAYAHRGYGLPDLRLKQYFYSPTSWEPPISPEEFKDIFQYVARRQQPRWAVLPLHNADDDDLATDTVNRIPQRFWNFNKRANEREDFWGIYVRERRSALMTGLYIMLSLAPFIGFCFLYSFGIVTGDIQNATTPLALSLTALGLFLGLIIKR
ncbi:hypothetical protein F4782DRAFT_504399 [Xylaria castorea]|nr:hypothetical protein F4782DRAFT_504399 [Xylaria castorea]